MDEQQFINSLASAQRQASPAVWTVPLDNFTLGNGQQTPAGALLAFIDLNQHGYGRSNSAVYKVVRYAGVDYAYGPGVFRVIVSPDDYWFLYSSGFIATEHGKAPEIQLNLLQYIRNEVVRWSATGAKVDDIVGQPNAAEAAPTKPEGALPVGVPLYLVGAVQEADTADKEAS